MQNNENEVAPLRQGLQKTLKGSISCAGVGLHSGSKVTMTLRPGERDSGIVFRRTDVAGDGAVIAATWRNVCEKPLCTAIANADGVTVATVEHLMAALWGCGVDNAVIDINGPEIPVMDGSSAPFVFLIECAGLVDQDAPRRVIEVLKPVSLTDGDRWACLHPADSLSVRFEIAFDHPLIDRQDFYFEEGDNAFKSEICRARTFGFEHEVAKMRAMGLARGGSLDNAVVLGRKDILNEGGLRYADEFVRHKVLDCIGDLYLAGVSLCARFHGVQSGHALTNRLLRALFADADAWRVVEAGAAVSSLRDFATPTPDFADVRQAVSL